MLFMPVRKIGEWPLGRIQPSGIHTFPFIGQRFIQLGNSRERIVNRFLFLRHGAKARIRKPLSSNSEADPPLTRVGRIRSRLRAYDFPQGLHLKVWASGRKRAQQTAKEYLRGYTEAGEKASPKIGKVLGPRTSARMPRKDYLRGNESLRTDGAAMKEFTAPAWRMVGLGLRATRRGVKNTLGVFVSHNFTLKAIYGIIKGISPLDNTFHKEVSIKGERRFDPLDLYFQRVKRKVPSWAEKKVPPNTGFQVLYTSNKKALLEFNGKVYDITDRLGLLESAVHVESLAGELNRLRTKLRKSGKRIRVAQELRPLIRLRKLELDQAMIKYEILQQGDIIERYPRIASPTEQDVRQVDMAGDNISELQSRLSSVNQRIKKLRPVVLSSTLKKNE